MKLRKELLQRHLEEFDRLFGEKDVAEKTGLSRGAGLVVRCAIEAGWFDGDNDPDAVGDMKPADVRKLSRQIDERYTEVTRIDPN